MIIFIITAFRYSLLSVINMSFLLVYIVWLFSLLKLIIIICRLHKIVLLPLRLLAPPNRL